MLNEVPEGWGTRTVGEFVSIKTGKLDANAAVKGGEYKFFTCAVEDSEIDNYAFDGDYVIIAGNGDFNVKHYVGKFNAYQRTYAVTSTSPESLDNTFLYFWQMHSLQRLRELSVGGVIKYLKLGMIRDAEIALPPLNEQNRIAEILSSVDESIQATQAVIEQAERVKRGLMEELLTGGLGGEAIERGEVPEGWQRTKQGSVATFFNGRAYKLTEWEKEGTPVIRLQNLTGSGKEYYYSTLELPPHQYCDFGDLLFMWSASFGAHIWQGGKAIYHYHIWKVEQDTAQLMRVFHYYLLQYQTDIWKQDAHGMAMLHLTKRGMEQLEITIPPLSQQKKIVQILSEADDFIALQRANAEQQRKVKKGLMDDLLTGKVRTV